MSIESVKRGKLLLSTSIILLACLILLLSYSITPDLLNSLSAGYSDRVYAPDLPTYCPGDTMTFDYSVVRLQEGTVEITSSWCAYNTNNCLLDKTTVRRANIFRDVPPYPVNGSVVIPVDPKIKAGEVWVYSRSVQRIGTDKHSMFIVPFTVGDNCTQ